MTVRTESAEETAALGARIAARLQAPAVVMLIGDLGAGKTTLTKGIVEALGAAPAEDVLSPTFCLVQEYLGDPKVYHIDLYRLDTVPEVETLGLEDLWEERAIVIVEWGEKFDLRLPGQHVEVRLDHLGGDARRIRWSEQELGGIAGADAERNPPVNDSKPCAGE